MGKEARNVFDQLLRMDDQCTQEN